LAKLKADVAQSKQNLKSEMVDSLKSEKHRLILSAVSNNFGNKIILVTGEGGFI
jgi:FlaA1/EpsC-like NDP-sugar epimerase